MDLLSKIAESRIRDAMARGEFDDLALRGQPILLEDLSRVPEDLRLAYKILKNAGVLPEELELRKEMATLSALLEAAGGDGEREHLRKKLNERRLRYRLLVERRRRTPALARYERKLRSRLGF